MQLPPEQQIDFGTHQIKNQKGEEIQRPNIVFYNVRQKDIPDRIKGALFMAAEEQNTIGSAFSTFFQRIEGIPDHLEAAQQRFNEWTEEVRQLPRRISTDMSTSFSQWQQQIDRQIENMAQNMAQRMLGWQRRTPHNIQQLLTQEDEPNQYSTQYR